MSSLTYHQKLALKAQKTGNAPKTKLGAVPEGFRRILSGPREAGDVVNFLSPTEPRSVIWADASIGQDIETLRSPVYRFAPPSSLTPGPVTLIKGRAPKCKPERSKRIPSNALKTKAGRLTAYGYACGYTEVSQPDSANPMEFWCYREHGTYCFIVWERAKCRRRVERFSSSLAEIRKAIAAACKAFSLKVKKQS